MQDGLTTTPLVWVYTTAGNFNAPRAQGYGAFLTKEQQSRLERIRQARLLFDGRHREYYLEETRTQFDFPASRVGGYYGDKTVQVYLSDNVLGLISKKSADLLFGAEPLLRVEDETQEQYLAKLVERSGLHRLFYAKAVDASYEAEAFLESYVNPVDGEVYLRDVPSDEIFPVGRIGPDLQYPSYERYTLQDIGTDAAPILLLLKQIYSAGKIERRVYQLTTEGQILKEVDPKAWPVQPGEAPIEPLTATGIDRCTITYVPNDLSRGAAVSDYDGAIDLQDALNAKITQIAVVLAKHASPKLGMPVETADAQGNARASMEVFYFRSKEEIPTYIVWNAQLEAAYKDRDFTLQQLLVRCEMSAVLLGIKMGGTTSHATSYKSIRLEAYNSVTKAARKAVYWKAGIKRALGVCQDLENANVPGVRYDVGDIGVELRDGIPVDDLEQAQRQSTLRGAGLLSLRRGITEQLADPAAVQDELDELEKENAERTPSILLGAPDPTGEEPGVTGDEEETAAEAAAEDVEGVAA